MARATLVELLERNRAHVDAISDDHFDDVVDGQLPSVVSLCCADSRVSQEGMWNVEHPGWLFTPSNIGNVAWDDDDPTAVDGNLLYPVAHTETRTITVIGHTGCGAVTAAYRAVTDDEWPDWPSIRRRVEPLVPVVEAALDGPVDDGDEVVNQLVEYNVGEQVAFLHASDEIPDDTSVFGFVYDLHGVYGGKRGRVYLVAADGETGPETLEKWVNEENESAVRSLL
ncbi:carbonic anhydrase [Halorarius litoreus]|uniref:carbonic anhydrase n=1 Tax=Halorarius litoreus TaxID=2962676 RepID=UPI0020CC5CA3|nr:carbonic anhydrase [Halorarius litoreus]